MNWLRYTVNRVVVLGAINDNEKYKDVVERSHKWKKNYVRRVKHVFLIVLRFIVRGVMILFMLF